MSEKPPIRIYSANALKALPRQDWLISELIQSDGLTFLYGPPKTGKTFVALDIAASVVTGRDWQSRKTKKAKVLYIASEGAYGIRQRLDAYEKHHGVDLSDSLFILQSIPLNDPQRMEAFGEATLLEHRDIGLIVVDTFARCFSGDENSAQDVGLAIQGLDALRRSTKATILVVHHSLKSGETYRGSSAIEGAADTMIALTPEGRHRFSLATTAQKNGPESDLGSFELIALDLPPVDGKPQASCVIQSRNSGQPGLSDDHALALEVLKNRCEELGSGVSLTEWRTLTGKAKGKEIPEGTFRHRRDALLREGLVESEDRLWRPVATPAIDRPLADGDGFSILPPAATTTPLSEGVEAQGRLADDLTDQFFETPTVH